jgi:polyhydroxybutyrate depolymerase
VLPSNPFHRAAALLALGLALAACAVPLNVAANDESQSLEFGGRTRSYIVHLPPGTMAGKSLPLVVNLHGGGGNARSAIEQTGFNDEADRSGFIVVYPNGTGPAHPLLEAMGRGQFYGWNAGTCCGYPVKQSVDDVGFIRTMISTLEQQYPIDRKRIYATGISNGAMMAYRLACEMSDTFAAVGIVSGALTARVCQPAQPVAVIHFHGTADQNVPLRGGVGQKAYDKAPKPPVMDAIDFWAKRDNCSLQPQATSNGNITQRVYACPRGNAGVVFYLISGGGHAWPGGKQMLSILDKPDMEISATQLIWQFFVAHPKS